MYRRTTHFSSVALTAHYTHENHRLKGNAKLVAVLPSANKIENDDVKLYTIDHNLSMPNSVFLWGKETNKHRHFAVSVKFFSDRQAATLKLKFASDEDMLSAIPSHVSNFAVIHQAIVPILLVLGFATEYSTDSRRQFRVPAEVASSGCLFRFVFCCYSRVLLKSRIINQHLRRNTEVSIFCRVN